MPDPSNSRFENFGRQVDQHLGEFGNRVEDELRRVITFLNDRVVPEVRQNSSSALRVAAEQLTRLAEHLDNRRSQGAGAPSDPKGTEPPKPQ